MKRSIIFLYFLASCVGLNAQDVHFSQFYASPLNINPAMTGVMNCNQRLSLNYRNQWASVLKDNAFQTASLSYDAKIAAGRYDYMGFGGTLFNDRAGSLNLNTTQLTGSFSYAKQMGGGYRGTNHYLSIGASVGYAQRSVDLLRAHWGEQNSDLGGDYDPNKASGETALTNDKLKSVDIAAGLMWFTVFDDQHSVYFGGAYSHINRSNQSFTQSAYVPLYSKFTLNAGGEFAIGDHTSLLPAMVMFFQGPSFQTNVGTNIKFNTGGNKRSEEGLELGAWMRLANNYPTGLLMDALILSTRLDYQDLSFGFSYDINVSGLQAASRNNGGIEFAVSYKFCGSERRSLYCPNF
jgi:type IX secretion system PorP/SprF family membrane protein